MYVPLPYGTKIYEIYFRLTTEVVLGNVVFFFYLTVVILLFTTRGRSKTNI